MKIRITFDLSTEDRLAIARYYGNSKPASRSTCANYIESVVNASIEGYYEMVRGDDAAD